MYARFFHSGALFTARRSVLFFAPRAVSRGVVGGIKFPRDVAEQRGGKLAKGWSWSESFCAAARLPFRVLRSWNRVAGSSSREQRGRHKRGSIARLTLRVRYEFSLEIREPRALIRAWTRESN